MDQSVFLVVDFSAVCRLCLSGRLLSDIHEEEESSTDPDPPLLRDQIALITGVQITPEDSLPQRICYKCRHLVDLASELRTAAVRAEGLLIHALADAAPKYAENLQPIDHLEQPAVRYIHTGDHDNPREISNAGEISNSRDFGEYDIKSEELYVIENIDEELLATETEHHDTNVEVATKSAATKKVPRVNPKPKRKNVCEICLTTLPSRDKLVAHVRQHYAGSALTPYAELRRPLRCEACARPVSGRRQLLEHHLRHLGLNPFVCREPGCGFVGKSKLKQHSIRHTDEGAPYPCRLCRVVCLNRLTLL